MEISRDILTILEDRQKNEDFKIAYLKNHFHLHSERNARVILNILETSPERWLEKVGKEIHKLEEKKLKTAKKIQKKFENYNFQGEPEAASRLAKLDQEIYELQRFIQK